MDSRKVTSEGKPEQHSKSRRRGFGVAASAAVLGMTLAACGPAGAQTGENPQPSKATHSAPATETAPQSVSETEANTPEAIFAAAEKEHQIFLDSLNPKQNATYERLTQEELEGKTPSQLEKDFEIPLDEVLGADGKPDPELVARSLALRELAAVVAPLNLSELDRVDMMNEDERRALVGVFIDAAARASIGENGKVDGIGVLNRWNTVEKARELPGKTISPYMYLQTIVDGSIQYDKETGNLTFKVIGVDNWNSSKMFAVTGDDITTQLSQTKTVIVSDIRVVNGKVVVKPSS